MVSSVTVGRVTLSALSKSARRKCRGNTCKVVVCAVVAMQNNSRTLSGGMSPMLMARAPSVVGDAGMKSVAFMSASYRSCHDCVDHSSRMGSYRASVTSACRSLPEYLKGHDCWTNLIYNHTHPQTPGWPLQLP